MGPGPSKRRPSAASLGSCSAVSLSLRARMPCIDPDQYKLRSLSAGWSSVPQGVCHVGPRRKEDVSAKRAFFGRYTRTRATAAASGGREPGISEPGRNAHDGVRNPETSCHLEPPHIGTPRLRQTLTMNNHCGRTKHASTKPDSAGPAIPSSGASHDQEHFLSGAERCRE